MEGFFYVVWDGLGLGGGGGVFVVVVVFCFMFLVCGRVVVKSSLARLGLFL